MNWFWLNIPLMAAFFLTMTGIPLWIVFKHPDRRRGPENPAPREAAASTAAESLRKPGAARDAELGVDVLQVVVHRPHRQVQPFGDVLAR